MIKFSRMKISVCIPVYNFDVRELIYALRKEIDYYSINAEIILIDDASDEKFKSINRFQDRVKQLVLLDKNIGRSKIRNLFLNYAQGDYLLFLDCDVKIENIHFLRNYFTEIESNPDVEVIYGNFKIDRKFSKTLRNRYSVEREIFSGSRSSDFSILKTVNFLIKRATFEKFTFNEKLTDYGYEDYIFAREMQLSGVKFSAINNPVIHFDDTLNAFFLSKTETAINSLYRLSVNLENETLIKEIRVYRTAKKVVRYRFKTIFLILYNLFENRIKKNLLSENPNLMLFDIYKLSLMLKKLK